MSGKNTTGHHLGSGVEMSMGAKANDQLEEGWRTWMGRHRLAESPNCCLNLISHDYPLSMNEIFVEDGDSDRVRTFTLCDNLAFEPLITGNNAKLDIVMASG